MVFKIHSASEQLNAEILLDFDNSAEEKQRQREEERMARAELAEAIRRQAAEEAQIAAQQLRNAAVNKELAAENRDNLLAENEALQQRIAATYRMMRENSNAAEAALPSAAPKSNNEKAYTGPSVLSYLLRGRKPYYLPVPVYKCHNGGEVTINITVAQTGDVVGAQVDGRQSTGDECLRQSATEAALRSKFSAMAGTQRQQGYITYVFIAQ